MDFLSRNSVNEDIKDILMNQEIHDYFIISDDLYEKKYNYSELYNLIVEYPFIKKYILFVVHYFKSIRGDKYYNFNIDGEMKIRDVWYNPYIMSVFNYLFCYNDNKFTYEILNIQGFSSIHKIKLEKYKKELDNKKIELFTSKQKLAFVSKVNNFLSDDLLEYICDNLINKEMILNLKNIKQNIKLSIKNTKSFYSIQHINYNDIYCYSWKFTNIIYKVNMLYLRPDISFVKNYQVLPFIFDHESNFDSCNGDCDYCVFKIDYPRQVYLYKKRLYNNRHKGKHSNFYNNWMLFQYYLICTNGRISKRSGFISIYNRKKNYIRNEYKRNKSHIILKNNIDRWKNLNNIWLKINNND